MRNEANADGLSQAQILLGHQAREAVVPHRKLFAKTWNNQIRNMELNSAKSEPPVKSHYDSNAPNLPRLTVGDKVRIQDHATMQWALCGSIVKVRPNGAFMVKLPSGRLIWRTRKFLYRLPVQMRS